MQFSSLLKESITLTFSFLKANKLRSILSVLGITIGIFCVVAVLTITNSLEQNIRNNVDKLGDNIIYIQKRPWVFDSKSWWEYRKRPELNIRDYRRIKKEGNKKLIKQSAFFFEFGGNKVKSSLEELSDVRATAIYGDFFEINKWEVSAGRTFTDFEVNNGKNSCILGYNVASSLFNGKPPIGKKIKINGYKVTIIGMLARQGKSLGGQQYDDVVVLPSVFARKFNKPRGATIVIKGHDDADLKLLDFEIKRMMRSMRKLKPREKDNFAVNKLTMFTDNLSETFGKLDIAGWIIGGFSLLVGGFGIANIMFVSVKERTSIIGLQKALGAKRMFIISQFLFEAVLLCIVGSVIGILFVVMLGVVVSENLPFQVFFSSSIFIQGVFISVLIGLVAGMAPAMMAASMDPVVALRK